MAGSAPRSTPALLGPWRSVDTAHFHIHFFQVDAQAVKDAAPRLDAEYEQMRQDYGLPAVDGEAMVTVEVTVPDRSDYLPGNTPLRHRQAHDHL